MPWQMSYLGQYSWPFGPSLTLAAMAKSKASDTGRKVKMIENLGSIA
jgi:hypothetical protein